MKLTALSSLPFAATPGWSEIEQTHPRLLPLFAGIILPLSLLPPVMLYLKGAAFFGQWLPAAAGKDWVVLGTAFFLTEMVTLIIMGWFIRAAAEMDELSITDHDAYLLASLAPIPLWLSSLGLLVPSLMFNAGLSVMAFALSCGIIYNGIAGLCHTREQVVAASVVHAVISAGLMAWVMLLLVIVL